jgi:hypothetical protein
MMLATATAISEPYGTLFDPGFRTIFMNSPNSVRAKPTDNDAHLHRKGRRIRN